jgi:hypothetical protein
MNIRDTCSHPGCDCTLEACSVSRGDRSWCCADCADGTGCEHEGCTCGRELHAPSAFTSFIQNAVRHLHE